LLHADEAAPSLSEYGPLDKQENRENLMAQNVQQAMTHHDVGIFVVGVAHLHSMSMKLISAGFNVSVYVWLGS
jgi:hypothetical protein